VNYETLLGSIVMGTMLECPICGELMCYDFRTFTRRELDWSRCLDCGFGTVFPSPSEEELYEYYTSDAYIDEVGATIEERYEEGRFRSRNWFELVPEGCESHLDFGAGLGSTLYEMRRRFSTIKVSDGCDIAEDNKYRDLDEVSGLYDMVTSFQTLEHVRDPKVKIDQLKAVTGKILMVEVPVWGRVWPHIHDFTIPSFEKMGFEADMGRQAIYAIWRR
jgi:hypothetical protein